MDEQPAASRLNDATGGAASPPRERLTLRMRVVMLVLSLLAPALLVTALLLWDLAAQAYRTQERQLSATARTLALVVDGKIGEQVAALEALSVSPYLAAGEWADFDAQARAALHASRSWVVVRGPDGQQYVNTRAPRGADLPMTSDLTIGASSSGGRDGARVSNLLWGPMARLHVIVVQKRFRLKDGRPADINIVVPTTMFDDVLKRQQLPQGWTATILDGHRHVVGRNRSGEVFVGRSPSPDMLAAIEARPQGSLRTRTLDGIRTLSAYDQVPGYGWTAIVAMPRHEALGAARGAILLSLGLGALLLALGVLMALRLGRRIAEPVETVAKAAVDWVEGRPAVFPADTGLPETDSLSRAMSTAMATVADREARHRLLVNELNHRVKNTLATVQAVAQHSQRDAETVADYHVALEGRVISMARAHEILTQSNWQGAELGDLARQTLSAFAGPRLRVHGPPTRIGPTDALNLSLVLYELATNAAKHGALSGDAGQVELSWTRTGRRAEVRWFESGGPPVTPPKRRGFGSRLISRAAQDLQPSAVEFAPEGLRCAFTVRIQGAEDGAQDPHLHH